MAVYPSYPFTSWLDLVTFAPPAKKVTSPILTAEGVAKSPEGGDAGASVGEPGGTPTVGSAAQASNSGSMLGPNTMANLATVNSAFALLGLPSVPFPATTLFGAANKASAALSGFNTDPVFGMPVAVAMADPIASQFVNPSAAAVSPLAMATIPPMSGGQSGFGLSPFSTGTPFSMPALSFDATGNPVGLTSTTTNAQGQTVTTAAGAATGNAPDNSTNFGTGPDGGGGGAAGSGGAPSGSAGAGGATGGAGEMHTGGVVRNRTPGTLEERLNLQQGEYVVRRSSAVKYRALLDAVNRDRPADVKRLAGRLHARVMA